MVRVSIPRNVQPLAVEGGGVVIAAAPRATAASTDPESPRVGIIALAYGAVVAATAFAFLTNDSLKAPLALATGASAFALFYVAAQAVERILEPFTTLIHPKEDEKEAAEGTKVDAAKASDAEADDMAKNAANAAAALKRKTKERTILFWALTSIMGMFASWWLGLYFLGSLLDPAALSTVPRWADLAITGVVIGGGSKGLHDLITRVQKPTESGSEED